MSEVPKLSEFSSLRFKHIFMSPKNSEHILRLVETNYPTISTEQLVQNLKDLQNDIYDIFFPQIQTELVKRGKFSPEESLIALNKLTINKVTELVQQTQGNPNNNTINNSTHAPITKTSTANNTGTQTEQTEEQPTSNSSVRYHHFISSDSRFLNGRYNFELVTSEQNRLLNTNLHLFKLRCNMYNITESNNKFSVLEKDMRIDIQIPVGYYSLDSLYKTLTDILNDCSKHKWTYSIYKDDCKNKTLFSCTNNNKPCSFNVLWVASRNCYSLREMFGFKLDTYVNNNIYVSENHPIEDVFDTLFLKVFINDKELSQYYTSNGFTYFHCFNVNVGEHFGRTMTFSIPNSTIYDVLETVHPNKISFELWNSPHYALTRYVDFQAVFAFEVSE